MKKIIYSVALFALAILISSCGKNPDAIFINGKIHTLDDDNNVVEALAVRNGMIMDIGTTKDITSKYHVSNVIDLQNKVVIPGFIDCDGSIVEFSKSLMYTAYLNNKKSIADIQNVITDKIKYLKENDWLVLYNLNIEPFSDKDVDDFDKKVIDKIANNFNIVIIDSLRTFTLVNSKVIETLQLKKPAPGFEDENIQIDDKGEFTGLFFDSAQKLIFEKIPEFSTIQIYNAVERGSQELLKYGITEVQDRTVTKDAINIFKDLIDSNKLSVKIYGVLTGEDVSFDEFQQKGIIENYKDKLTVRAVCLDYDGALEIQDASMKSGYLNEPKDNQPYIDSVKIEEVFNKALDKNFQFRIKVIGDKGVNTVLNSISRIVKTRNPKDIRTVIEYAEFISPQDIQRFKELNIIPSIRPETTVDDIGILPDIITPDNLKNIGVWKSLIQSGGKIITGSGFPFENQINPFIQIYYLTQRKQIDGSDKDIPNSEQKVNLLDALKSYTIWACYSGFEDNIKGNLMIGKAADMIILSDDIFNSTPDVLLKVKVDKTIINGIVMYDIVKN